jgi:hypothetical protein
MAVKVSKFTAIKFVKVGKSQLSHKNWQKGANISRKAVKAGKKTVKNW